MTRGITRSLALLAFFAAGCGDAFEEGRARSMPEGLKLLDVKDGTGNAVQDGDQVEVRYKGWLKESQKLFADSPDPTRTSMIQLGEHSVPQGLEMGMLGMKESGIRRIFVPAALGYGVGGGRDFPPNADLVYEVQLVKIHPSRYDDSKATKTPSGLKIEDTMPGTGAASKKGDKVKVHYTGWLRANGTEFDSSMKSGMPFEVTIGEGRVIRGWDEGLVGIKVGGKRRLFIPAQLAYGETGQGSIPPNAALVFDVELVSIE